MRRTLALFGCISLLSAVCALSGSCTGGSGVEYVRLSDAMCTFRAEDNRPLTVRVNATGPWRAETGASWVKLSEEDGGVVIGVDGTDAERETEITVVSGSASATVRVLQLAPDGSLGRYRLLDSFSFTAAMSKSGRYVAGVISEVQPDSQFLNYVVFIDLATDERIELGPYPASLYDLGEAIAVSDRGEAFFYDNLANRSMGFDLNGNVVAYENVPGHAVDATVENISSDGRIWVGYSYDRSVGQGGLCYPVKWVDGVPELLPMPELNVRDEPYCYGIMARGISADGSVIYGTTWDNNDFGMVYWKDGKVDWVGSDVRKVTPVQIVNGIGETVDYHIVDCMMCYADQTCVSPNGKWIAGAFRSETLSENGDITMVKYPAFFNTETGRTTVVKDFGADMCGIHVTDEGVGVIIPDMYANSGYMYDIENGVNLGTCSEWVFDHYGLIMSKGFISYVTPDGSCVFGGAILSTALGPQGVSWYVAPPVDE